MEQAEVYDEEYARRHVQIHVPDGYLLFCQLSMSVRAKQPQQLRMDAQLLWFCVPWIDYLFADDVAHTKARGIAVEGVNMC